MRSLSPDEAELWARVTATIRPLSRERRQEPSQAGPDPPERVAKPPFAVRTNGPQARTAVPPAVSPRPGTTLDSTWDKKLRTGSVQPDRVIDLHGLNLDAAWSAIDGALERAIDAGDRVVLLITGHERAGEPPVARGRIRAAVHDWLAASRHASKIAAVRAANRRHGGGGSLYLVLRRR